MKSMKEFFEDPKNRERLLTDRRLYIDGDDWARTRLPDQSELSVGRTTMKHAKNEIGFYQSGKPQ